MIVPIAFKNKNCNILSRNTQQKVWFYILFSLFESLCAWYVCYDIKLRNRGTFWLSTFFFFFFWYHLLFRSKRGGQEKGEHQLRIGLRVNPGSKVLSLSLFRIFLPTNQKLLSSKNRKCILMLNFWKFYVLIKN
jgi:hypothetical protein